MNESTPNTTVTAAVLVILAITSAAVWFAATRDLAKVSVTTQETSETTENDQSEDSDTDNEDAADTDGDDDSSDRNDDDEPTEDVDWSFLNGTPSDDSSAEATDATTPPVATTPPQGDPVGSPPDSDNGPIVMIDPIPADGEERVDPPAVERPSDGDDPVVDEDDEPRLRLAPGYEDADLDEILTTEDPEPETVEATPVGGVVVEWEPPVVQVDTEPPPEPTVHVIIPDAADLIDDDSICAVADWC